MKIHCAISCILIVVILQMCIISSSASPHVQLRLEQAIQEISMEQYLIGVLLSEMPMSFHEEALKAQAVAARTFVCKAIVTGGKHLDGSVCTNAACCQGYLSEEDYLRLTNSPEALFRAKRAVSDTSCIIAVYQEQLIDASYFACSGGKTEAAKDVWGMDCPYLLSNPSPGEENALCFSDTQTIPVSSMETLLQVTLDGNPQEWFQNWTYTDGGGVAFVEIAKQCFSGQELRKLFHLRSTLFTVTSTEDSITFHTRGYGHRVGMSQYGANSMANSGKTYEQILQYYYSGITFSTVDTFLS